MRFINAFRCCCYCCCGECNKKSWANQVFLPHFCLHFAAPLCQHSLKNFPFSTLLLIIHDEYSNAHTHTHRHALTPAQRVTDTGDELKKCCVLSGARVGRTCATLDCPLPTEDTTRKFVSFKASSRIALEASATADQVTIGSTRHGHSARLVPCM